MRYIEINEKTQQIDYEYYLVEGCGIFAYILSKFKPGSNIVILSDPDGEEWSDEIPYEVTHVALEHNGNLYDVRGKRSIRDMIELDFPQGLKKVDMIMPSDFKSEYMDGTDRTPLYAPMPDDIKNVVEYIKHNQQIFDLTIKETSTSGGTSAGGIATVVGGLGAGFDPNGEWRSIYPSKTKKKKPLILKR